jgi:hypothetical protein
MPATANKTLSALWYDDPERAKSTITRVYRECACDALATARALRIGQSTLYRWIEESLDLKNRLHRARHDWQEQVKTLRRLQVAR